MRFLLGPDEPALEAIRRACGEIDPQRIRIIVAWARVSGVALLFDALAGKEGLVEVVVGMAGAATSAEALAHLRMRCAAVHVFHKHHRQTFHPKVYCLDTGGPTPERASLLVGSSNMTAGGLFSNYEGNTILDLRPQGEGDHAAVFASVARAFGDLGRSPYCERLRTDARIEELLQDGYVSTEAALRRRSSEDAVASAKLGRRRAMPEAPPPRPPQVGLPPLPITFTAPPRRARRPAPGPPAVAVVDELIADGRFFVRTLTQNDIGRLNEDPVKRGKGTFEPDLSVTARDEQAAFWGWPLRFNAPVGEDAEVGGARAQWLARARVISTRTPPGGVVMELLQWFRPARPRDPVLGTKAHAAEHRLRLGPIPNLRRVIPLGFDTRGLVVVSRCNEDEQESFVVRLIAHGEPDYPDYFRFLAEDRPKHSYGYGMLDDFE